MGNMKIARGGRVDGIDSPQADGILLPFVLTPDEWEADNLLADLLVNRAAPVIESIVKSSIGRLDMPETRNWTRELQDVEDVVSEAIVKVLDRLRRLRDPVKGDGIGDFLSYVTVIAHHTCDAYLRVKHPNRTRLRRKLRYVLTFRPEFAVWKEPDEKWVCGFSQWRDRRQVVRAGWINQALMDPKRFIKDESTDNLSALLRATFNGAQAPIEMDDLVTLAAEILKISDEPVSLADLLRSNHGSLATKFIDPVDAAAQRLLLERVWKEIVQLPLRQRISLLLAVRDESRTSIAVLLAEIRIASVHEIGDAVGVSMNEFVQLLPELPLSDKAISKRLDVTRQQIISSRFSGRRRLNRRVKGREQ